MGKPWRRFTNDKVSQPKPLALPTPGGVFGCKPGTLPDPKQSQKKQINKAYETA
jgi:hypothetical protein